MQRRPCIFDIVKFVKMLMFLLDLHEIMKVLSLHFQRKKMLLIDVLPLLQTALLDLENLRGGRGTKMLQFTRDFNATGTYKGVKLDQVGYKTRGKSQSRLDQLLKAKKICLKMRFCLDPLTFISILCVTLYTPGLHRCTQNPSVGFLFLIFESGQILVHKN